MIVACVLKSGGIYSPAHVDRLQQQVKRHTDCRFVCFSDMPLNVERIPHRIPLKHDWSGWWSKIELFRIAWKEPVVYLDLDVVVQGDVSVYQRGRLTMATDFLAKGGNSSLMAWTETPHHLYETFNAKPERYMREYRASPRLGDQSFIYEYAGPDLFPREMVNSYRVDKQHNAPVIAFHGKPKPWDL